MNCSPSNRFLPRWSLLTLTLVGYAWASSALAGDWPQILGPNRNGIATKEKLAQSWPADGPKVVWQRETGEGFAGVAVAGGRAVLFHRIGDEEIAEAMNAATGKVLWKRAFPTRFESQYSSDHGPRCVPLIHTGKVYLYGAARGLHCVDLAGGKKVWSRDAFADYCAVPEVGYFGAGSSPIVAGGKLLVNIGGARKGAGIVAFSLDTGQTLWKASENAGSYSSPIAVTLAGTPRVIFVTRFNTVSINPDNGKEYWSYPFGKRGPTVNAASPLVLDGHLFLSASYGIGAVYAKIEKTGPRAVWKSDEVMSSQYTTCVPHGGYLYGIHGREDQGEPELRCINPKDGKVLWKKAGLGKGTLLLADGKLILQCTSGDLYLAEATPQGYRQLAHAQGVTPAKTFALPALSDGKLYVRGPGVLKCLQCGQ